MNRTLYSFLDKALREMIEGILTRPLLPPNVNVVTLFELQEVINRYVSTLKEEKEQAKRAKEEVNALRDVESSILDSIRRIECLTTFYENFWEEKVPEPLKNRKEEIIEEYNQELNNLEVEEDNLNNFLKIENKSKMIKSRAEELNKKAQKLIERCEEELIKNVKAYLEKEKEFVNKFRESVVPKLQKTDKLVVQKLLNDLSTLYKEILSWIENIICEIYNKKTLPDINQKNRTLIFEKTQKIKKELISEIKDLNEQETLILMEVVKILSGRHMSWPALTEACEVIAKNTAENIDVIKKIMLDLSEKGFLTLLIKL